MLIQYVKNHKGQRIGVVVAESISPKHYNLGWSQCNLKEDKYRPDLAMTIAMGRLANPGNSGLNNNMPHEVKKIYSKMKERASKYFKAQVYVQD